MNLRDAPWPSDEVVVLGASALLPRLEAVAARAGNRLYGRQEALRLPVQGPQGRRTALLRWRWSRDDDGTQHATLFRFRIGTGSGTLGLSASAEAMLLAERQADRLPYELRCVLLADALADVADAVQRATQQAFAWDLETPAAPPAHAMSALQFDLAFDDAPAQAARGCLAGDAAALLEALAAGPNGPDVHAAAWDGLAWPLSFELGRTTLPLHELRTIERGDIVAVDRWRAHGKAFEASVVLAGRHRLGVRALADGSRVTLQAWKDSAMNSIPRTDAVTASSAIALDRLDDLDVSLRFEVGELQVTLRELRTLQPGHVFELGQPLNRCTVRIHAHGRLLGHGDLVAVGDRLGVRVVELSADAQADG